MTTATTTILSHVRRERAYPKTVKTKHLRSEKNLRDAFPENAFRYYCLTCFRRRTFRRETYGSAKNRDEDVYFHFRERISDVYHVTSETDLRNLRDAVHIQQTQQTYTVYDSLRTIRRGDGLCILGCTRCVASVGLRIIHSISHQSVRLQASSLRIRLLRLLLLFLTWLTSGLLVPGPIPGTCLRTSARF